MPCRATQCDITKSPLISVIPGSSGIRPAPRRFRGGLDARRTSAHLPPGGTPLIPYNVPGCGRRQRERRFRRHVVSGWKAIAAQRVWRTLLTTSRTWVRSAAGPQGGCRSRALTARPRPARAWWAAGIVRTGVQRILGWVPCSGNLGSPWAAASAIRPQTRSGCQPSTGGINTAGCGERIERCPQGRKSAPVRVHGYESVREPTTVTLADQGLRESRRGWSQAASGSVMPSKGSPVASFDSTGSRNVGQANRDPRLW